MMKMVDIGGELFLEPKLRGLDTFRWWLGKVGEVVRCRSQVKFL
jgi:hypothetical protein